MFVTVLLMLGAGCQASRPAPFQEAQVPHAHITLFVAEGGFRQGQPLELGLLFQLDPGWHIYWKNPGDSGLAPSFQVKARGATLKRIDWPLPKRLDIPGLAGFGYDKEVLFPILLQVDPDAEQVNVHLKLDYLICAEICVPGSAELDLVIPRQGEGTPSPELLNALTRSKARVPPEPGAFHAKVTDRSEGFLTLAVTGGTFPPLKGLEAFPENGEFFSAKPAELRAQSPDRLEIALPLEANAPENVHPGKVHLRLLPGGEVFTLDLDASGRR